MRSFRRTTPVQPFLVLFFSGFMLLYEILQGEEEPLRPPKERAAVVGSPRNSRCCLRAEPGPGISSTLISDSDLDLSEETGTGVRERRAEEAKNTNKNLELNLCRIFTVLNERYIIMQLIKGKNGLI